MTNGWNFPGPRHRGENWVPMDKQTRWARPEWKSLAWVTQLLAALACFFVVMAAAPRIGTAAWWLAIITTALVLVLVSVLAVKR